MSELSDADEIMEAIEKSARIDLRDRFAGLAMSARMSKIENDEIWDVREIVKLAYVVADEMIKEREK